MADAGDVIVVGVGLAGGAAALALARADRHPILVDPGDGSWAPPAGAGILGPRDIPPEVRPSFPVDRRLSDRRLLFLGASSSVSIDYQEGPGSEVGIPTSFVRARTDPWLAGAAVAAGADRRSGPVDRLLLDGGRVLGVILGGTELRARLTILADGPRAFELADGLSPGRPAAGPTEVTISTERLALPGPTIEERFDLAPGGGVLPPCPAPCSTAPDGCQRVRAHARRLRDGGGPHRRSRRARGRRRLAGDLPGAPCGGAPPARFGAGARLRSGAALADPPTRVGGPRVGAGGRCRRPSRFPWRRP